MSVNAHLTSWLGISTISHFDKIRPCCKIGQGQPRVIYTNFVELESPILHAKFHDHRTFCSGEKDFLRFLPYIDVWSCDPDSYIE